MYKVWYRSINTNFVHIVSCFVRITVLYIECPMLVCIRVQCYTCYSTLINPLECHTMQLSGCANFQEYTSK